MKEWMRTVILLMLLVFSIGFIIWMQSGIDSNFAGDIDRTDAQEYNQEQ